VRVTVLNEIPEDPQLCEAWNNLVLRMENPEVFFTYQWALAASRSFHTNLSPLLFLLHDSSQLAGVAALAIDPASPRKTFFLNSATADYCDIVSAPAHRSEVLAALLEEIEKLGLTDLVLANVPADSATLQQLGSVAQSRQFYLTSRIAYNCGIVQLGGDQQRKTLLRVVSGKDREKRGLKKLRNLGSLRVTHLTRPEEISSSVESIVSAQVLRFLASGRVSPLAGPERRIFLRQLSDLLSHAGWLKISQLEIDGHPIAWNYGFLFGGSWFWYLPTFQLEYEHASPGSCLLRLLIEEGVNDSSLRWLDLGLGDESYKERFANNIRQTRYLHLSRGFQRHFVSLGRETISRTAARFPRFADKLRGALAFCHAATGRIHERGIVAIARQSARKVLRTFASKDEVLIFEGCALPEPENPSVRLLPLTREHLVSASIANADDASTLRYLMRCARRLTQPGILGFFLQNQNEEGRPLHFLWIGNYDGFHLSEIDHTLEADSPGAAMIFDCWTPAPDRGCGHYATAIRLAAATLSREGRPAWIFTAAGNVSSLRGILKAGFTYRFSLIRRTRFGHSAITRRQTSTAIPPHNQETPHPALAKKS
jgi:CelD/BcsL family acetyltransferase involved in cellulose biosynthesis